MSTRVLVTGAGGDTAQGVIRALRREVHGYIIASVCINEFSAGLFMSDISEIAPPYIQEKAYVEFLIKFVNKHSIDIIIPTIDGELSLICRSQEIIESKTKAKVIIGSLKSMMICADKLTTSKYLKSKNIDQPETMIAKEADLIKQRIMSGEKIIMKPRVGGGSKGIRILHSKNILGVEWQNDDFIYQSFDKYTKEFTAVVMKNDNEIVATAVFERLLVGGRTTWCKRVPSESYNPMLYNISGGLDIPYLNIQFGMINKSYNVFDLNPRFSGSTGSFSLIFNGPHLLAQKYHRGVMPFFLDENNYFESVRYLDEFIIHRN